MLLKRGGETVPMLPPLVRRFILTLFRISIGMILGFPNPSSLDYSTVLSTDTNHIYIYIYTYISRRFILRVEDRGDEQYIYLP
jgi:hypothetical protein|uniref:Uncharacterized protein n=1 Tax=Picea glauca TaxID=3330 RepID=A0A117NHK4_PICGL|nr:hypothetical protein ABT39_MTgene4502 [Picea glauca]QHR87415.1 hypothetical protein Q903MT_gene1425 [Picea sitchensis]